MSIQIAAAAAVAVAFIAVCGAILLVGIIDAGDARRARKFLKSNGEE